jgi:alpha-beta hydrolase superfamily lysophospholipase
LSRDPGIAESVLKDPLYRFLISARLGIDILKAGDWALEHASEFPLPLLLMHGTSDRVTSPDATKEFASKVKVECLLKLRDGFYHELLNEPEKGEVLAYITKWMGRGGKAGLFIQPE